MQSAKDLLIQLFALPRGEIIFQDYSCALKGLFSKYGRIFLAENHICFYANLGGSKTKLVIKLDDVSKLEKKAKSDIEINLKDSHIYCFNSFSDRDQVYNLMNALLTGQPVQFEDTASQIVTDDNAAVLENADVEINFLASDGKQGDAECELCKLTFPINVEKFFEYFIGDEAIYSLLDHRASCQDTDPQLSKWQPMEENYGSFQRELKTVIKLVDVPFKDKSRLHKLQTYKKEEGKITLNATTHTLDVPYGNYFQLEERWEITNLEDNKCSMRMFGWVQFTKSTIMKGKIMPRSIQGLKEDYEKWTGNVKQKLEQLSRPKSGNSNANKHEYEDSKNLGDYNILNKVKKQVNPEKKQIQVGKLDQLQLGAIGLLIVIMVIQVLILNRQSKQIDNLERILMNFVLQEQGE